jgi:purine-nucleoside phosphorylase
MTAYERILNGNKEFGTNKNDIVKGAFKCEPQMIEKNVIIAPVWRPEIFLDHVDKITQTVDGIYKIWNISIKEQNITYIVTGIGAPVVMDAVLALSCTPCEKIIFIGSVGGLDKEIKIGEIVIPEYSICGDGACRYLTDGKLSENNCFGEKYYPNKVFYDNIISTTKIISNKNNVKWHIGKNYSIDTIVAQFAHIGEIINMNCNCIEMETAALFKSAAMCKIKAGAIFSVSDNTVSKKSLLSGRTKEEKDYRKFVCGSVLTKIALESFKI